MRKQFLSLLAIFAVAFVTFSCQQNNSDARDAARTDIETVTPANPAAAQPNPAGVAVPAGPITTVEFADGGTFDFGTVTEGEIVSHTFSFTNTGSEPLIISDAKGSCGCTVPSKPTAPIAPGEDGEITVQFNSKSKKGARNQKVTVTANTNPAQTFIYLTGTVNPDPNAATQK